MASDEQLVFGSIDPFYTEAPAALQRIIDERDAALATIDELRKVVANNQVVIEGQAEQIVSLTTSANVAVEQSAGDAEDAKLLRDVLRKVEKKLEDGEDLLAVEVALTVLRTHQQETLDTVRSALLEP